ncbi:hypothetical protein [Streptomyces sp. C10-9-1]|uniref:hypothetical protein n=1 Tax=Streptomyces sp. C10-9-1 TaxID=1859285 RepID=UPI003D738877
MAIAVRGLRPAARDRLGGEACPGATRQGQDREQEQDQAVPEHKATGRLSRLRR